jgi:membrane-bound lytic murein transglycosylase A
MISRRKLAALMVLALSVCFSCAVPPQPAIVPSTATPFGDDLDVESLRAALRRSLEYLEKLPPERVVGEAPRRLTAGEIVASLKAFEPLLAEWNCPACFARDLRARFEFVPSSAETETSEVLFTGYYQPVLAGSRARTEKFRYPVYGRPVDLIAAEVVTGGPPLKLDRVLGRADGEQFLPYYTRSEIDEAGRLRGRGLEIAWVADPVELFFLHIQGSGIIRLAEGGELSVGYAAQNGWPYRSIGRLLIDDGKIAREAMSMQRLRRYLNEHPTERSKIFGYNPSYVFFRVNPDSAALGSLEVPVTAGRSIATDARLFPKGALALIETELPAIDAAGQLTGWRPIMRFVLNQDTGGAIRGLQRADIYFGAGGEAEGLAGYMNRQGRIFFLVLKKDGGTGSSDVR